MTTLQQSNFNNYLEWLEKMNSARQTEVRGEAKNVSIMKRLSKFGSDQQQQGTKQDQKCVVYVDSSKGGLGMP